MIAYLFCEWMKYYSKLFKFKYLFLWTIFLEKGWSCRIELESFVARFTGYFLVSLQKWSDFFGKSFTQLDTPLIKAVNIPQEAFNCSTMFIDGKKLSCRKRSQLFEQELRARSISWEEFMIPQKFWDLFRFQIINCFPKSQSVGLSLY